MDKGKMGTREDGEKEMEGVQTKFTDEERNKGKNERRERYEDAERGEA